jgi:predicted metal-dependent enzyme (double-stranded beta helix superfamily)
MFDLDAFLDECVAAGRENEPQRAVKELLTRTVADPARLADALPPERAQLTLLHRSDELTIAKVVWGPGQRILPHDHLVWATIGLYTGGEDNAFYRDVDGELESSGGRELRPRDVCLLGREAIHAVTNPTKELAAAIHVYGGDLLAQGRSEWDPETLERRPYDHDAVLAAFEAANEN